MTMPKIRHLLNYSLLLVCTLSFIYSCGSGSPGADSSATVQSAALVFQMQFQHAVDPVSKALMTPQASDPDICNDYGIGSVLVEVHRSSDDSMVASVERTCGAHGLTVNNLSAGVNLYLVCKGFVDQQIGWQG